MLEASASGCVASLLCRYVGQQLVDHLRNVDLHEPAKWAPPLPINRTPSRIREPERAVGTDPYVLVRSTLTAPAT
jgi:hypothetical protein